MKIDKVWLDEAEALWAARQKSGGLPSFQDMRALSHAEISKLNCAWGMQNALPHPWPLGRNFRLERVANGR